MTRYPRMQHTGGARSGYTHQKTLRQCQSIANEAGKVLRGNTSPPCCDTRTEGPTPQNAQTLHTPKPAAMAKETDLAVLDFRNPSPSLLRRFIRIVWGFCIVNYLWYGVVAAAALAALCYFVGPLGIFASAVLVLLYLPSFLNNDQVREQPRSEGFARARVRCFRMRERCFGQPRELVERILLVFLYALKNFGSSCSIGSQSFACHEVWLIAG